MPGLLPIATGGEVSVELPNCDLSSANIALRGEFAAVVTTDLLDRFGFSPKTEKGHIRMARILALCIGLFIIFFSPIRGKISGNITTMTGKTVNLFVPLIFCLFFFALFVKFSKPAGVWAGWVCGLITAILIAFSGDIFGVNPETGYDPISFQWTGPVALLVNMIVGTGVSYVLSRSDTPSESEA